MKSITAEIPSLTSSSNASSPMLTSTWSLSSIPKTSFDADFPLSATTSTSVPSKSTRPSRWPTLPLTPVKPGNCSMRFSRRMCSAFTEERRIRRCFNSCATRGAVVVSFVITTSKSVFSCWMKVRSRRISMLRRSNSSFARHNLKYTKVAACCAGFSQGAERISWCEWHSKSNSPMKL